MSKSWDKIFLVLSLLVLAGTAGYLGYSTSDVLANLAQISATSGKTGRPPGPLDPVALQQKRDNWLQPRLWDMSDKDHQLFVGRRYLYFPDENVIKLYEDNLEINGLPVYWIEKYKLPISDVLVARRDPDGDGFTNLDEFKGQTDPLDPNSHPPYSSILRMKSCDSKRYLMKFDTMNEINGVKEFGLQTKDSAKTSRTVRIGDVFDGLKVVSYTEKHKEPEAPDYVSDVSELQLFNDKTQENVVLVINKEQDVPQVSASFVLLIPGLVDQPVSANVGDEFVISVPIPKKPKPLDVKFKLIKATPDSAVVLDEAVKTQATVPLFDDKADPLLVAQPVTPPSQ